MSDTLPKYMGTRAAAAHLGYGLETFERYRDDGWIAGCERQGAGPMPRWRYVTAELAYIGPVQRPFAPVAESAALAAQERAQRGGRPANPYLRRRGLGRDAASAAG